MSEPKVSLSAGKYRCLQNLADDGGRFKMVAVDQRPPLFRALARHGDRDLEEVGDGEISDVKKLLVEVLARHSSAILVDPIWAHPDALPLIPGRVGLISTLEDYAFEERAGERYSLPIEGWSVAKIKRCAADGVKVLAYHRPDLSPAAAQHQDAFVASVGEACRRLDIPFILELIYYPKGDERVDSPRFASQKPEMVLTSLRHFAQPRFAVDLFKLEFPADLKHTFEFASGAFDGREREPVYRLAEVEGYLRELDSASPVPWVLLSAGVGRREFAVDVELAVAAGASGFLAGRAVWFETLDPYPDMDAVRRRLIDEAVPYLASISGLADRALPWTDHRRFGGAPVIEGAGRDWFERYAE
ncbi:MAG TPA: tagatose 1,6-diphosphate aldolase [Trueperaceae bacterium]